jgi:hypothetical protein
MMIPSPIESIAIVAKMNRRLACRFMDRIVRILPRCDAPVRPQSQQCCCKRFARKKFATERRIERPPSLT